MISSAVLSRPDGRCMIGWCSGSWQTLAHTLSLCETILTHHGNLVSHNNTGMEQHTHTQTHWWGQVSRLLFLPGCLSLRHKALFYVEKGWDWERGLCQSPESRCQAWLSASVAFITVSAERRAVCLLFVTFWNVHLIRERYMSYTMQHVVARISHDDTFWWNKSFFVI